MISGSAIILNDEEEIAWMRSNADMVLGIAYLLSEFGGRS
jgi:hypothetical protein